eukprot:1191583-Prorocentrum_minimum.AAC.1
MLCACRKNNTESLARTSSVWCEENRSRPSSHATVPTQLTGLTRFSPVDGFNPQRTVPPTCSFVANCFAPT